MISSSRGRKRRIRTLSKAEVPSRALSSTDSSPAMAWTDVSGRLTASLRSLLLVFTLVLAGYVTWRMTVSAGDSSVPDQALVSNKVFSKKGDAVYSIQVLKEYRHDPGAFTQGLLYAGNDTLFESTGLYGQSTIRKVLLQTGQVKAINRMDSSVFGEGLTLLGERLFQVTWQTRTGFIYDRNSLKRLKTFTHQMDDGWGLTTDGKVLFGSDGSSTLYELDPNTMKVSKRTTVKYNGEAVFNLNELEYIDGEIWANIWMTDCIAKISPSDGTVQGWILLHNLRESLLRAGNRQIDVLNGIAWDQEKSRIFVTGKLWPKLYEISLKEITGPLNGSIEDICQLKLL
ncbi:glutaminyl cyclase [Wolffia australiana]